MNFIKATYKDVGFLAFPGDNSYSMNLSTLQNEFPAGKEVKIISRPFKIAVMTSNYKVAWKEFVIVNHKDEIIRVLNEFQRITTNKT